MRGLKIYLNLQIIISVNLYDLFLKNETVSTTDIETDNRIFPQIERESSSSYPL